MPIITKPATINKGVAASFSLDKAALAAVPSVAANTYYSNISNWKKVSLYYTATSAGVGSQIEVVQFDATQPIPAANFLVSPTARDSFIIAQIVIRDADNGCFIVPRAQLTTAEFDVNFSSPAATINYPNYSAASASPAVNPTNLVFDQLGHYAISNGILSTSNADFNITFELSNIQATPDPTGYIRVGLGFTPVAPINLSQGIYVEGDANGFLLIISGTQIGTSFGPAASGTAFSRKIKISQASGILSIFVNDALVSTAVNPLPAGQFLYPTIYCYGVRSFTLTQSYTE